MGLSSNQVSSDGLAMSQGVLKAREQQGVQPKQKRQLDTPLPLRCPRCDSSNTKFCYYNNYSKSQPRHFCKSCRRHWTNGGTLRNVPVGGGRKSKRPKTSHPSTTIATSPATTIDHDAQQQQINMINSCGVLDSLLSLPLVAPFNMMGSYDNSVGNTNSVTADLFSTTTTASCSFLPFMRQEGLVEEEKVGAMNSSMVDDGIPPWQQCDMLANGNVMMEAASNTTSNSYWSCWDDFPGFATQPYRDLHY